MGSFSSPPVFMAEAAAAAAATIIITTTTSCSISNPALPTISYRSYTTGEL